MKIPLIIRTYDGARLVSLEHTRVAPGEIAVLVAGQYFDPMLAGAITMVELEFVEDPDPRKRFFRIGTDPEAMRETVPLPLKSERNT